MSVVKDTVREMLANPHTTEWTLQGLGMLRAYLDDAKRFRLHVWDKRFQVHNVSLTHTHPWDFKSRIIAGAVHNIRWAESQGSGVPYYRQTILCGPGGGLEGGPQNVLLKHGAVESYDEGDTYTQKAREIHTSSPVDGTVTLIERDFHGDVVHANVYWRIDREWVSAEPRPATRLEVDLITGYSLYRWF